MSITDKYWYIQYDKPVKIYTVRQTDTGIYSERQIRLYAVQLKVGLHISVVTTVVLVVPLLL